MGYHAYHNATKSKSDWSVLTLLKSFSEANNSELVYEIFEDVFVLIIILDIIYAGILCLVQSNLE